MTVTIPVIDIVFLMAGAFCIGASVTCLIWLGFVENKENEQKKEEKHNAE